VIVNWGDERLPERFWRESAPEPNSGCWLWLATYIKRGVETPQTYRLELRAKAKTVKPNRIAYSTFVADIPHGGLIVQTCGNSVCVNPAHLECHKKGDIAQFDQLAGQRFGKLVAVRRDSGRWLCECDCGQTRLVTSTKLTTRVATSCGCLRHGRYGTPIYRTWQAMLSRCRNSNLPYYKNYGGRGIKVCERWSEFKNFAEDMGERPPGMSIDRVDTNGDYCPENCRWADVATQNANKRDSLIRIRAVIDSTIYRVAGQGLRELTTNDAVAMLEQLRSDICGDAS
jgi:hypothetical protein